MKIRKIISSNVHFMRDVNENGKYRREEKISHFIEILAKKSLSPFNGMRKFSRGCLRLAKE